ncbi:MAG: hypothetical protein QXU52_00030 [Fervidicoccaceae archaeon]
MLGARAIGLQISPESQDEHVRRAFGRSYDSEPESFVRSALERASRVDLYFMVGLLL